MNIFFDIQGTLISGGTLRPGVREVFAELTAGGHEVYLWSSGGRHYCRQVAEVAVVEDLVSGYYSKAEDPVVSVDFAVDDTPGPPETFGGLVVAPFAGDPEDRELWRVIQAVRDETHGGEPPTR